MPQALKQHKPQRPLAKGVDNEQARDRQQRRMLPTNCAQWRKIRQAQLEREPLCRDCGAPATEVDHISGDTFDNLPDNLASRCKPCHSAKTWRENRGQLTGHDTPRTHNARERERNSQ